MRTRHGWLGAAAVLLLGTAACLEGVTFDPYRCSAPFDDSGPLVLEWPRNRMVVQQRDGVGDLRVRGRLQGVASASVDVRVSTGASQRLAVDGATGVFDGVLAGLPVGWMAVEVRLVDAPAIRSVVSPVGVGNVVVLAGQSNMVMLLNQRDYTRRGVTALGQCRHPADPNAFAWAADPLHDCMQPWGSIWPRFGDEVTKATGAPLMLVASAVPTTGLAATGHWLPGGPMFEAMLDQLDVATAEQRCVAAVLWLQGELDAQLGASRAAYRDALVAFAQGVQDAASCEVPVIAASIGDISRQTGISADAAAAVRDGTLDAVAASPFLHPGPWTLDLPIAYLHFTDAAAEALLARWCDAIAAAPTGLACQP
jgi:Carbohydrate esterase, sialic acid-specific acetylesterase